MANSDIPVPVWNTLAGDWEPVDFWNRQRVTQWPPGFNPHWLPTPEFQEGDRVQFVRDETCAREGIVRRVLFQGDLASLQDTTTRGFKLSDHIIYIVTARGHDHRVRASSILGRFVSLERISRVLPLQE